MKLKLVMFIVMVSIFLPTQKANAEGSIISDLCLEATDIQTNWSPLSNQKYRCEQIKNFKDGVQLLNIALYPAMVVFKSSSVQSMIRAELAAQGLLLTNPVLLTVTIIGAAGLTTIHYLLKLEMEECERLDQEALKQQLLIELNLKLQK